MACVVTCRMCGPVSGLDLFGNECSTCHGKGFIYKIDSPECVHSGDWRTHAPTPARGEPSPQTREYWEKRAMMDQELILEQREEIGKLKAKVNKLEQRIASLARFNPDWDQLEAAQESLREHMNMVRDRDAKIAELEQRLRSE